MYRRKPGFSMVEILIVLAIVGMALSLMLTLSRPAQAHLYANDLKAMIQQARFESIKRNVAVAVVWDADDQAFKMLANSGSSTDCTSRDVLETHPLSSYSNLELTTDLDGGMVWLPTGLARSCNGGLADGDIVISDEKKSVTLSISVIGKVTIE